MIDGEAGRQSRSREKMHVGGIGRIGREDDSQSL